ncbi:MAG: permease-like cell division protein FtsX [Saprospiraceae bacterium]
MFKTKPATVLSVISFAISLFVLGFYLLLVIHLSNVIKIVNEKTPFIIELRDSLNNSDIAAIKSEINSIGDINSIEYISKEQGLEIMKKNWVPNFDDISKMNPLKDVIKVKLSDKFINSNGITKLSDSLKSKDWAYKYYFEKDSVEALKTNLSNLNIVLLFLAILFIFLSLILIYNNLRFILHADKQRIKTMELIGASPEFLKKPYIKLAIKIGLYSASISIFMIILFLFLMNIKFDIASNFLDIKLTIITLLIIFIISITVPPLFINNLVIKFLKKSDKHTL